MSERHIRPMSDAEFDPLNLDEGIRDVVMLLRKHGFDTCDSGDGFSKDEDDRALDVEHVFCVVDRARFFDEVDRLCALLPHWRVEGSYGRDGKCLLSAIRD